jgi:hypothetical protein
MARLSVLTAHSHSQIVGILRCLVLKIFFLIIIKKIETNFKTLKNRPHLAYNQTVDRHACWSYANDIALVQR